MHCSTGRASLKTCSGPPHMMVRVPSFAFVGPPDIGASRKSTPFSEQAFAQLHRARLTLMYHKINCLILLAVVGCMKHTRQRVKNCNQLAHASTDAHAMKQW